MEDPDTDSMEEINRAEAHDPERSRPSADAYLPVVLLMAMVAGGFWVLQDRLS